MQSLTGKNTGDSLTAVEWNQLPAEVQNVITGLGIALSPSDLNQLGKAIAGYAANGQFYTDSGVANAYVLTVVGAKQKAPAYSNGFTVYFRATNNNTAASTVNVAGLGVKAIVDRFGNPLPVGAISISDITELFFDSANDRFVFYHIREVAAVPVGGSIDWNTNTPPSGYLEEDGSAVSRVTYADLFAVIGVQFGPGDGVNTFNLADKRGEFPRFWDHGAGNDPGAALRTDRGDLVAGDNIGTKQLDTVGPHNHGIPSHTGSFVGGNVSNAIVGDALNTTYFTSNNLSTNETRGRNIYVMSAIKF